MYKDCCREHISSVLEGYNSTIFMYGATASGKTYSMIGDIDNPGILPFALLDIYE